MLYDANVVGGVNVASNQAYDPLGKLQAFQRGTLNSTDTAMSSPIAASTTTLQSDTLGNYTSINEGGTENVTASYDSSNAVVDANGNATDGGNTTSLGQNTSGDNINATYDAWGRLVKDVETAVVAQKLVGLFCLGVVCYFFVRLLLLDNMQ